MAQDADIPVPGGAWKMLTDSDVTAVSFAVVGGSKCRIRATAGTTEPADIAGPFYRPQEGEYNLVLADAFPGVSGANRLWAWSPVQSTVWVNHA